MAPRGQILPPTVNWDHPDNNGLAVWLLGIAPLDGGRTWHDVSGKTAGGVLASGASWTPTPWGQSGISLNAAGQYGLVNAIVPSSSGIAVACWYRQTVASSYIVGLAGLVGTYNSSLANSWFLRLKDGALQFGGTTGVSEPSPGSLGQWYRVAGVYSAGTVTLYRSGIQVATGSDSFTDPVDAIALGVDFLQDPRYFTGQLAGIRVQRGVVPSGWAQRDYEWSCNPRNDPRLRLAKSRQYYLVASTSTVSINANGRASTVLFGSTALSTTTTVSVTGLASAAIFGSPAVTTGVNVLTIGLTSSTAFGTAAVTTTTSVQATPLNSSTTFGSASVTTGSVIATTSLNSATAYGSATLTTTTAIAAQAIPSAATLGTPSLLTTTTVQATGRDSTTNFGSATLLAGTAISATAINSTASFGGAALTTSTTISAQAIPSGVTFGAAILPVSGAISCQGLQSGVSFGAATLATTTTVTATAMASAASFGSAQVTVGTIIVAQAMAPTAQFGAAQLATIVTLSTQGLTASSAFGVPSVLTGLSILAQGRSSSAVFGTAQITVATVITSAGIPSGTQFGNAQVVPGTVSMLLGGIPSTASLGSHLVSVLQPLADSPHTLEWQVLADEKLHYETLHSQRLNWEIQPI